MDNPIYIDANNLLWRCLHTQAPIEPGRTQLGATRTLLRMLARLKRTVPAQLGWKSARLVVAWDDDTTPLVRQGWYPQYKMSPSRAGRQDLRQDAKKQRMAVKALLRLAGIEQASSVGWEADDVIGTMVTRHGGESAIASNDRDLYQLLDKPVVIVRSANGGGVELARYINCSLELGVSPDRVADYKALVGDKSDNIPGAFGVGPARALLFLREFKTAEAACEAAEKLASGDSGAWTRLPRQQGFKLALSAKEVRLAYRLCKLNCDVQVLTDRTKTDQAVAKVLAAKLGLLDHIHDALETLAS